jgi:hypothetical protein
MSSRLESRIAKQLYRGLKGKMLRGTLRRQVPASLDSYGDHTSATINTYAFEGIREDFSAYYKAQAGIPATDVKILVLAQSITVTPQKDDLLQIRDAWYCVRTVLAIDPANATVQLQCFAVPTPT